jgi:hypothetical protein
MKNVFLLLIVFSFALTNCSSTSRLSSIGKIKNGDIVFTQDKNKLLANFNANLLTLSGIDGQFTTVNIKSYNKKQYYLVFEGAKYKSTFSIDVRGDYLTVSAFTTCTTSACSGEQKGCVPNMNACTPCGNGGACTKNVSIRSLLADPADFNKN